MHILEPKELKRWKYEPDGEYKHKTENSRVMFPFHGSQTLDTMGEIKAFEV